MTKDHWWFVILVALLGGVVTVTGVFLGATWALRNGERARRRSRADEAAVKVASAVLQTADLMWSLCGGSTGVKLLPRTADASGSGGAGSGAHPDKAAFPAVDVPESLLVDPSQWSEVGHLPANLAAETELVRHWFEALRRDVARKHWPQSIDLPVQRRAELYDATGPVMAFRSALLAFARGEEPVPRTAIPQPSPELRVLVMSVEHVGADP